MMPKQQHRINFILEKKQKKNANLIRTRQQTNI